MRFARLIGVAHCIVPQQIVDPSLHMQPPITLQKMMKPQSIGVSPILQPMEPPPSIVQIIVPAALVQATNSSNVTSEVPNAEKVSNDTTLIPTNDTHSNETLAVQNLTETQLNHEENQMIHHTPENDSLHESSQEIPAEKSIDESHVEEMPETDPIHEFNKIRSSEVYPPLTLPEILHEVLPQPQRTHASLEDTETELELPAQKDAETIENEGEEQKSEESQEEELLQDTLTDAETPS